MIVYNCLPQEMLPLTFSADGNTLLIGPENAKLAFDLRTRTQIKIGGDLKNKVTGAYAFLGNDRIAGIVRDDRAQSGIFSFPDGRQLKKVKIPFNTMESVSMPTGENVLTEPTHRHYSVASWIFRPRNLSPAWPTWFDLWNGRQSTRISERSSGPRKISHRKWTYQNSLAPQAPRPLIPSVSHLRKVHRPLKLLPRNGIPET